MTQTRVPPGPRAWPVVGNLFAYLKDPLGFFTTAAREYGDVVRLRLLGLTGYVLYNPADIEHVLRGNHRNFVKDKLTRTIISLVGNGLITSEGDFWRRHRQMAQPAFPRERVQRYAAVMVDYTRQMLDHWSDGQTLDVHHALSQLALRVVGKTLFAAEADQFAEEVGAALDVAADYFMSPISLPGFPRWIPTPLGRRYRRAVERLDRIVYELIRRGRARPGGEDDLLAWLLAARDETGATMTDLQLRDELMTLLLAGHETTALTLTYAVYLLACNPAAEARLTAELDEILGDRPAEPDDLPRLRYTGWVVHEALRLYPPAWSIAREAVGDCEIGGYPVPRGTQLWLVQWVVHRDPRWYEAPDEFRPERWDNDLERRLPRCAYFPFGDGPRICIGQHFALIEASLMLATVAQRYRLALAPGHALRLQPSMTVRPKGGLRMIVQQRAAARR